MKNKTKKVLQLGLVSSALIASAVSVGALVASAETTVQTEIVGSNITLQNDIKMNYYFTLAAGDDFDYAEFTFGEGEETVTKKVTEYAETENGYKITFDGISPDKLDANLSTVIYLKGGATLTKETDSVIAYCQSLLGKDSRTFDLGGLEAYATDRLIADLLTYGNESYKYVNKTTDDAAYVSLLTEDLKAKQEPYVALESGGAAFEGEEGSAVWYSATANFYSNVRLSFKFYVEGESGGAYTVRVTDGNSSVTLDAVKTSADETATYYQVMYDGISLLDFDKDLKATVLDAEGQEISNTLSYGVADYVYNKQDSDTMSALVKATYNYGLSAQKYVKDLSVSVDDGITTPFRMEIENAELVGYSGGGGHTADVGLFESRSYFFNPRLSGGLALRNFSPKDCDKTNSATFRFTSDKTVIVKAIIGISAGQKGAEDVLDWCYMTNNGRSLVSGAVVAAKEDLEYLPYSNNNEYYKMTTIEVEMVIFEGGNEFKIVPKNRGETGNIDYIELQTSATITDYQKNWLEENSVWEVTQAPTRTETGILQVTSPDKVASNTGTTGVNTFILPAFSDELYTHESTEDKDIYSFTTRGQQFRFELSLAKEYTLTLENGATFTEDGTTSKRIPEGEAVPSISVPDQAGRTHIGFFDTETKEQLSDMTSALLMPSKDTMIAPLFASDNNVPFAVSTSSAINNYVGGMTDGSVTKTDGIVGDEKGAVLTATGPFTAGMGFRVQSAFRRNPIDYVATYTFENFSASTVCFKVYQTNSGTTLTDYYETVTLEAGATTIVSISFYFDGTAATGGGAAINKNALTYIIFEEDYADDLNLGVCMNIEEDENGEHPAETYQLTLEDGLQFADGSTVKSVKAYSALSDLGITYTGSLTGTVQYLDKSTLTLVSSMTAKDVTLTPYVDQLKFGEGQNGNAFNKQSSGVSGKTSKRTGTDQVGYAVTLSGIKNGSYGRFTTPYSITSSNKYEITYVFVNTGASDIAFTLYQINAGTTTTGMDNKHVSIAAGESVTVTLTIANCSNSNLLSYFTFDGNYGAVTMNALMTIRKL